jgi:RimJ/RimL family protein N-acetyltransferase
MEQESSGFKWCRPPFMITPYVVKEGLYSPQDLVDIFNRLKAEDLYETVFHDNPGMNLLDFMSFFSMPSVMLQIIHNVEGDRILDMMGIAWLAAVEQYGDRQRAVGSFCVFKNYQKQVLTQAMAQLTFGYWFEALKMDIVVGMTPAANLAAVRFIKRIGCVEACRIPNYSHLRGTITDCVITYMDKEKYTSLYGG